MCISQIDLQRVMLGSSWRIMYYNAHPISAVIHTAGMTIDFLSVSVPTLDHMLLMSRVVVWRIHACMFVFKSRLGQVLNSIEQRSCTVTSQMFITLQCYTNNIVHDMTVYTSDH